MAGGGEGGDSPPMHQNCTAVEAAETFLPSDVIPTHVP
jgi:hypothetical protein